MADNNRFIDTFTLLLIATMVLASLFPATGAAAGWLQGAVNVTVVALFFLHGARTSRTAFVAAASHWRLHATVLLTSFALFPALGLMAQPAAAALALDPQLRAGLLFLCCLPSTVQSSIAFTAIARGNVPAAVYSASLSNLVGVFVTPLLVGVLLSAYQAVSLAVIGKVVGLLLVPFVLGHLLQPWLVRPLQYTRPVSPIIDRGAILLIVYAAFGDAVRSGIWSRVSATEIGTVIGLCALILAAVLGASSFAARKLAFPRQDEIAIVFCGSKKSLLTGVPMANVLFTPALAGVLVIPLMIFHQIQLMVCAALARRYARAVRQQTGGV
jgi:sodium/bile acid cotransporter 7